MAKTEVFPQRPEDTIRILFCCDPGYYQHLAVAIVSLLDSNRDNALDIHLIAGVRDPAAEQRLRASLPNQDGFRLQVHEFTWPDKHRWHTSGHITAETYTRVFCPQVLDRSIDKILYLDADLVVVDDLLPLWRTEIGGAALAACPDPFGQFRRVPLGMPAGATYVNAGVLLINLQLWRAEGITTQLADYIRREGRALRFHDQDAINALLHRRTKLIDLRWNLQARSLLYARRPTGPEHAVLRRAAASPAIIHYASNRKPWIYAAAMPKKGLYRKYLRRTAWRATAPLGRSWRAVPERLFNASLCALNIDSSWDDIWQATPAGKAIAWWALRLRQEVGRLQRGAMAMCGRPLK